MEYSITLSGYCDPHVIHFNPRTALVIQRVRRVDNPNQTVICKGNTFFDEEENIKLKHEYEILHLIHSNLAEIELTRTQNHTHSSGTSRILASGNYSRGEPLTPVSEDSSLTLTSPNTSSTRHKPGGRRPRSTSLSHDSIDGHLSDRIVKPISLEDVNGQYFLILEDYGGMSLREFALGKRQPQGRLIGLEDFLHIATQLAEALDIVHAAQVVHKDINPDNIVVRRDKGRIGAQLIDFNLAEVTDMGTQPTQRNYLEGTLAYLSPEQTGRMQRVVDYRTDFYSLGITLWEVLVGSPPFQFDDATEYVHAHLAKEIEPANLHDPLIPKAFSDIINKLVSKAPEARYQSASGLRFDFMTCMRRLKEAKAARLCAKDEKLSDFDIAQIFNDFEFDIASRDYSHHLNIPDKLYGRDRETKELLTSFENVACGKSRSELVLVCGGNGEGKSSLINHLRKHVMRNRGFFVRGQYTEYNRDKPFGGLVQALDELIRQLLGETAEAMERWQNCLNTTLGPEILAIVTDVLPDLEMIVGLQQSAELRVDATSAEQTSFIRAMQALIGCFAQAEHPLVVFLDDLQYAESASQKLLQAILFDRRIGHLLIVATLPSGSPGAALGAAFGPTVQRIQFEAPQRLRRIELGPLTNAALREMLSDTLKPAAEDIDVLASLVSRKTMGNPLHVREFLRYAEQQGLIYFNEVVGGWAWDVHEMERQTVLSENVADLLLTRLRQFSPETQTLLQQAACIGDSFDLRLLSFLSEISIVQVATLLWAAVKEGFLLPQSQEPPLARSLSSLSLNKSVGGMVMSYKFCHNRLHRACYDMIDPEVRRKWHLQIGRLLRRNLSEEEKQENVFTLVAQYNEVLDLLTDREEPAYVARLNYEAGLRAKKSNAHHAARRYFSIAQSLLGEDDEAWKVNYEQIFNIKKAVAQVNLVEGLYDEATAILKDLCRRATSVGDQLTASSILVSAYHIQGRFNDIMEMGFKELKAFDIPAPENEQDAISMVRAEISELERLIAGRSEEEVAREVRPLEPTVQMLQTVLLSIGSAAGSLGRLYQCQYFYVKGCVLAMQKGLSHRSAELFAFVLRAYAGCLPEPDFPRMRWVSKLSFLLMDKATLEIQARARLGLLMNGYIYVASFKSFEENVERCITAGIEAGYYSVVIYAMCTFPGVLLSYGRPAAAYSEWHKRYHPFMEKFKGFFLNVWNGTIAELDALSSGIECVYQNRDVMATGMTRAQVYYFRLVNALLFEREDRRMLLEQYKQEDKMNAYMGIPRYIDIFVWQVIIAASEYNLPNQDRKQLLKEIDDACAMVKKFAEQPPQEIMCKYYLVSAERARILGDMTEARNFYDKALDAAHEHGFRFHEALITERYGRFWLEMGSKRLARSCLHDAYFLWHSWGSEGKCKQLQARYADIMDLHLLNKGLSGTRFGSLHGTTQRSSITEQHSSTTVDLDLTTVLKVTQSISNETSLEILLTKIIKFVMENAGAEKGMLVLQQEGKLLIEALGVIDEGGEHHEVLQHVPIEKATHEQGVPLSVVYYVFRSREPLVLVDAVADQTYGKDAYVTERQTKSILCCPIVHQNMATGVVYLENDLQTGAFTADRLELIQSLMAAASMSIENAKLAKTNTELTAALRDSSTKATPRYNLDGPIKKTIDMLQGFKFRLPPGDPGIRQIDFIMKALTSTDFFSSNIDEINDETGKGIDSDTKVWIESSLLQKEPSRTRRADAKEHMFAKKAEDISKASLKVMESHVRPSKEISSINMAEVNALLERSTSFDFNIYDLAEATNGRPLFFLGVHLLEYWGLLQHFSLDEMKLRAFFEQIEGAYHPLPYHNSTHGADVLQTVNMLLLSDPKMAANFTKMEIFAACIASAVHDVDHPGLNNNFLVQSSHPLAIFYNDMSVLEFHHAAKAFEIAQQPETNVFDGLNNDQYREARKLIISMVVATDMAQHFHYINKLKSKIAASALNWEESGDRALLLECAIKCADLNNSAKPIEQSRKWAFQVMQEFFLQGDRERKLGMPVSKFMDRYDTNIPKCQIGFIDILVVPLFDSWSQCIQTDFSRRCMDNISQNRSHWESLLDKPEAIPNFPPPPDEEREDFPLVAPSTPPFTPQQYLTAPIVDNMVRIESKEPPQPAPVRQDASEGAADGTFRSVPGIKLPGELKGRLSNPPQPISAPSPSRNIIITPRKTSETTSTTTTPIPKIIRKSTSGGNIAGFAEGGSRDVWAPSNSGRERNYTAPVSARRRSSAGVGALASDSTVPKIPGKLLLPALPKSTSASSFDRELDNTPDGLQNLPKPRPIARSGQDGKPPGNGRPKGVTS
ncbi:serine/threonine protein kinase [Spizellomyces punctatus DAOM BR117]|uniref:Phosphodiesterase n=1 Tax=Spizellomyces punctatus (strain DAOM BR117) TaxID=645134 RepID=A0A0L0HDH0_SPIPD|nr:serine/threonine protein kinase [Spizellomyces punctatus DAOM BR117]KNC99177.1 serine/threonine protein kinase [Spizellomyces punctatus DAOM BR117]|eukprot:XP_016607217.1 serine/threonine protein kinase [Spizellomyces punctatus DAOM BR117]